MRLRDRHRFGPGHVSRRAAGADLAQVAAIRSNLPVYIAVGQSNPVNGGLALLTPLSDRYKAVGLTDVTIRIYPDARHEILNETNRDEIIAELNGWLDRVVSSSWDGGVCRSQVRVRKNSRRSAARRSGASRAAKWPPRSNSDQRTTLWTLSRAGGTGR